MPGRCGTNLPAIAPPSKTVLPVMLAVKTPSEECNRVGVARYQREGDQ